MQRTRVSLLLNDARNGSPDALGSCLEFYRPYLTRLAEGTISSELRPKLSASDVVQGTLAQACRRFDQFQGNTTDDLRAWLLAIFRNHLTDGLRRYRYAGKRSIAREAAPDVLLPSGPRNDPGENAELEELAGMLMAGIERLSADAKQVVRLRYIEGKSFTKIAEQLNLSRDGARRLWLAALDELTVHLQS